VKLLLDENLAPRLTASLQASFPASAHVRDVGLKSASDVEVWEYAGANGFVVVSKDWDFQQLSFLHGAPPKVVWIRRGNCSVQELDELLRSYVEAIKAFGDDLEAAVLVLG
jgi:predicted nuclease of predicted toxin-antitoxin system